MLEKPGAQNIAMCENQGKQHELSDQLKCCFWKKNRGWGKKDKKFNGIQVLTKDFYVLQNQLLRVS